MKLRIAKKVSARARCPRCGCCWTHRRGTRAAAWRRMRRAGLTPAEWMLPGVAATAGGALVPYQAQAGG